MVWQKPLGDRMKLNCDGAFDAAARTGGWGFVIRDSNGDDRGSGAGRLPNVATTNRAEAEACAAGLQAASDWGMTNVDVESDCQVLINAIQGKASDRAIEGVIFRDIQGFAR
ncbi:uncharacterized protein [Aegilops tauschii subsp. strangulata]|uniref:uncharacterized protein n=1 Tax=Aegilops tauschii subsp. strangulata TaxID=200361 RepID=UPI003CC8B069